MTSEKQNGHRLRRASKARAEGRVLGTGVIQLVPHNTPLPESDLYGCVFSEIKGQL